MEYKDYYKVLEVEKGSSQDEIKKSYRRLAKKYHPDLHPDDASAQDKFKEINEAYEVLGDEEKKEKYDTFGSSYDFNGGQNFDPSQYGFGGNTYTHTSGSGGDFSDFFNMFFGGGSGINDIFGGGRASGRRAAPRQSYETEISIGIEEGFNGVSKDVSISLGGSTKRITVKIPKGITPGKKIRVKGEKWGIEGDILFKVNFKKNSKIILDDLDITQNVDILPWEAALGAKIVVSTLHGKIRVTVPKGIVGGRKIRIPKKGYKDMKNSVGNLYIQFNIINPPSLSKEEEELYKQLMDESKFNPREN